MKLETLQDLFNGSSLNGSLWGTFGAGGTVSEGSGYLDIVSTTSADYHGIISVSKFDLTNSYAYEYLAFNSSTIPSLEIYPAKIDIDNTGNNQLLWLISPANHTCKAYKKVAGVSTQIGSNLSYTSSVLFFRIKHTTTTIYWDYSADNITWTNLTSCPNPFADITQCYGGCMVGTWQAETGTSIAYFKDFNIVPVANSGGILQFF
jgi:hypothetical protein